MRDVVFVNNTFVARSMHTSGGDERFKIFIEDCKKLNLRTKLLCSKYFSNQLIESNAMIKNSPFFFEWFNIYIYYFLRTIWLVVKIKKIKNSIIIIASDQLPDTLPIIINNYFSNKNNIYIAMSYHEIPHPRKRSGNLIDNYLSYWSQKIFYRYSHIFEAIAVPSENYKKIIIDSKNSHAKVKVLPMKIHDDSLNIFSKIREKKYDLIYVGRITPNKGVLQIPSILSFLSKKINLKIVFVGSGKTKVIKELMHKLQDIGVYYEFAGFVNQDSKFDLIKSSKCLILPSKEEGFSMSISEALKCGVNVVCWDIPTIKSIYREAVSYAEMGNEEAFATKIIQVLSDDTENLKHTLKPSVENIDLHEKDFFQFLLSEIEND